MTQILYLFADTNLFIQCKDLRELDWSEWENFEEVHIMVCLPVQREIDDQRKRGNGRVPSRARKTYSQLFRGIATRQRAYELIRESDPCVKLFLEFPSLPDPDLTNVLNYDKVDDEMVGCLHRFKKDHPEADARLLTDDTGPMMSAGGLGLEIAVINPEWLLPPENDDSEREIARLRNELYQIKRAEPLFDIGFHDGEGAEVERLEFVHNAYEPLSKDDLSKYMAILKDRFPLQRDFSVPSLRSRSGILETALGRAYGLTPPSAQEIARYQDREYPEWLENCREVLSNLHETLQRYAGQLSFEFVATNRGTRPGNDALLAIGASGNFKICPPPYRDEESTDDNRWTEPRVPLPPTPPRGRWSLGFESWNSLNASLGFDIPSLSRSLYSHEKTERDPNGFYYKPTRIKEPAASFSIECQQWRHGTGDEPFCGEIYFNESETHIAGLLQCEIHAENLSEPAIKRIPVRIEIRYLSAKDYADSLLDLS